MKTVIYLKASDRPADHKKLNGVYDYAREANWNIQVVNPVSSTASVKSLLSFWEPAGCIVSCGSGKNDIPSEHFAGTPLVYLDRPLTALSKNDSYVFHDSAASAKLAMRELLDLGLSHFAFVHWNIPTKWDAERAETFSEIMRLAGRPYSEFTTGHSPGDARHTISELVKWMQSLPRPLGVFASADPIGALVIEACHRVHLNIPEEVAVISINNDLEICENTNPTLSSINPDFNTAGRLAAKTLDQLMTGKAKGRRVSVYKPIGLVRRQSTMRFKHQDKTVTEAVERIRKEACNGMTAIGVLKAFNCSRRMAEIRFKAATGKTVLEAIQEVRLAQAKEIMSKRTLSLEAIANFCGYKNLNAFSMFFKSQTGQSPSSWRLQYLRAKSSQGKSGRQGAWGSYG